MQLALILILREQIIPIEEKHPDQECKRYQEVLVFDQVDESVHITKKIKFAQVYLKSMTIKIP
jgi:hypothetical protein